MGLQVLRSSVNNAAVLLWVGLDRVLSRGREPSPVSFLLGSLAGRARASPL